MSLAYLAYCNWLLLTRLIYLRRDGPVGLTGAWLAAFQVAGVAALFQWNGALFAAVVAIILFTGLSGWLVEPRGNVGVIQLVALLGLLAAPVISGRELALNGPAAAGVDALFGTDANAVRLSVILLELLLLANEVNLLVRVVFAVCGLVPHRQDQSLDEEAFNAGRVIGILERWLMFLVVLWSDDLNALGFIVAAKGLMRMEQLKERDFAEYMLVGTLLSVLFAVVVAKWVTGWL
jgi:hypothetical protein